MGIADSPRLSRLLRSRLLHFVVLGTLVFVLAPRERSGRPVRIEAARIERAWREEQARLGHLLTTDEKQRLLHALVDEELLYREGRRLGLDANDPIVRARVAESMRQVLSDAVPPSAIAPDELAREAERIAAMGPESIRLSTWFVSRDRPGAIKLAERIAADLKAGITPQPLSPDRGPIADDARLTVDSLARIAGAEVARVASATPVGQVSEPIAAAWGFFVVRPLERKRMDPSEARATALSNLRARRAEIDVSRTLSRVARDVEVLVETPPGEPPYDPTSSSLTEAGPK